MPSVITDLCLRDGACVTVCPVDCIVPGSPIEEWPHFYIDAEACIDCSACIPECPQGAIYPSSEVPDQFNAKGGEVISMPVGTDGFTEIHSRIDINGDEIILLATRTLETGEIINLTNAIQNNIAFFEKGPGYSVQ